MPQDFLNDPEYGIDAIISVPNDDLLPLISLTRVIRRHVHQEALIPDQMIEFLLQGILSCASIRPSYNLTIEDRSKLTCKSRREVLEEVLDDLDNALARAYPDF